MQTYPIQTVPSASPTTFIYASQLGLALNCDLMTGLDKTSGSTAVDDGPAIIAAMAGATANNPLCLVMDGSSCVSGLNLPAGGHWSIAGFGRNTGFFQKSGSNNHVIHNGTSTTNGPGGAAPARGSNVSIRDIFINGNRGNGSTGNSTTGDARGNNTTGWYLGFKLENLNGVQIENVQFFNTSAYNVVLSNCGDWTVDNCHFENFLPTDTVVAQNSDGLHIDGPSNDGRVSNCFFRTGDDAIALNAPEEYGGLITRIAIVNCTSLQSQTMMRIYAGSLATSGGGATPMIDGVTITNYQGSANIIGFLVGVETTRTITVVDAITNVAFVNCKVASQRFCAIQDNVGTMSFDNCDWITGVSGTPTAAMFTGCTVPSLVSSLAVSNCRLVRTSSGSAAQGLIENADLFGIGTGVITWKRIHVNGLSLVDLGFTGSPLTGLLNLNSGATIGELHIADLDASNITALMSNGVATSITSISGGGVLQTGWQIPAGSMAKWTPYVDSSSSLPSYKNAAGTVVLL